MRGTLGATCANSCRDRTKRPCRRDCSGLHRVSASHRVYNQLQNGHRLTRCWRLPAVLLRWWRYPTCTELQRIKQRLELPAAGLQSPSVLPRKPPNRAVCCMRDAFRCARMDHCRRRWWRGSSVCSEPKLQGGSYGSDIRQRHVCRVRRGQTDVSRHARALAS